MQDVSLYEIVEYILMKKEICKSCEYYVGYYKKRSTSFVRLGHGFCSIHKILKKRAILMIVSSVMKKRKKCEKKNSSIT